MVVKAGTEEVCASLDVEKALWDRIHATKLKGPHGEFQPVPDNRKI